MKKWISLETATLVLLLGLMLTSSHAQAAIGNADVLDDILHALSVADGYRQDLPGRLLHSDEWRTQFQGNECSDGNFYRAARTGQQDSAHAKQHVGGGAGGIGNLGAGAAIATAATPTGIATGMMMASAANAAGGASAIKAAFDAAHASMEGGMGMFAKTQPRQNVPLGGLAQAMGAPSRFVAEMGSHLARGGMEVVESSIASQSGRVAQTPGGKIASAIRFNIPEPQFKGNAFAGSTETKLDAEAEAAAFRDSK